MKGRKITVTLSEKAEAYFNELMYSIDDGSGKPATQSDCINWALESHADFEANAGVDLVSHLQTDYGIYTDTKPKG